ncbi:SMI1/KNR4 family protein [Persicimonas caeni]|nr:SMI1/KNR4 family protein [Persicimonas caeni]
MGTHETEEAARLIQRHSERADFRGGASDHEIARAEDRLGVKFPPSYRRFLEDLGAGQFGDQTFFGVIGPEVDSMLDVVSRTLDQRTHGNLPTTHVVVAPYGSEAFFGFDCADRRYNEECPVAEFPRDYGDTQEPNYFELDFGSFLLARIRDELGERGQFLHP